jgi:simple sugar transport system permease protein
MADLLVALLSGTLVAATPLIYAALGELLTERAGVINLGVEGMMLLGAVAAFAAAISGAPALLAVLAGAGAGTAAAACFAALTVGLASNQYAAGLALTMLGSGLSALFGHDFGGRSLAPLAKLPLVHQDAMVLLALPLAPLLWLFLYRTRPGLMLRVIGDSPQAAQDIGLPVRQVRFLATLFGGAMAGLGGAYLALAYTPLWIENMTAGRGWIALALVVFGTWNPGRVLLGAWLFGGVSVGQLFAQGAGVALPPQLLASLPYLATILVLLLLSRQPRRLRLAAPAALGQSFTPLV